MSATAASLLGRADQEAYCSGEMRSPYPVLVLAMGNILLEDEGLGIHALNRLKKRFEGSAEIEFMDGGTSGMALVDVISKRKHLLVLDAVQTGDPPGTLVKMANEGVPVYFGLKVTPHQLGLADVLASLTLMDEQPECVTVLGLVPQSMEMSLELSDLISSKLDDLVAAAESELLNSQITF